jgi:hypothetical protein
MAVVCNAAGEKVVHHARLDLLVLRYERFGLLDCVVQSGEDISDGNSVCFGRPRKANGSQLVVIQSFTISASIQPKDLGLPNG